MDEILKETGNSADFEAATEMRPWGTVARHWHDSTELILVLCGSVSLTVNETSYLAAGDDIILVNANEFHEIASADGVYITVNLKPLNTVQTALFECNSVIDYRKERFKGLKRITAHLMKESLAGGGSYKYKAYTYSLLDELTSKFSVGKGAPLKTKKYLRRLNSIMRYVNLHYAEQLTLNKIAEVEHLSVPYLSSFFEKYIGVGFSQFYANIRLDKALKDIVFTDLSIEEIAFRNGFGDPRSFVAFFKKKYDMLPSQYRKLHAPDAPDAPSGDNGKRPPDAEPDAGGGFRKFNIENYIDKLLRYLKPEGSECRSIFETTKYVSSDSIDMLGGMKTLTHNFKKFISVGRAKELLSSDVQEMLCIAQRKIGYEYVKFHGILSDDMCVYHEDEHGRVELSFVLIDKVIDFLVSIGLKPLIQLSFMPRALASVPGKAIFYSKFYISPPKNTDKWVYLVEQLIAHLQNRYGKKNVEEWLFCVWHEPNFSKSPFSFKEPEVFFAFYRNTYAAVKRVNPKLVMGTPSLVVAPDEKLWLENFFDFTRRDDCMPEFINLIYYNDDMENLDSVRLDQKNISTQFRINSDENAFAKYIAYSKELFAGLGLGSLPVYLTEWNLTISHRNLLNDTCFKSCYIVKNLLENYDELSSFGYWLLTDMIEETQPNPRLFHGGLGLFTYNGTPKPHYFAYYLLNKLGNILVTRGDGYFITKSYGAIQLFLYNYQHFNYHLASGETYDVMFTERYAPFSNLGKMDISLTLKNIPAAKCLIKEYIVNQAYGSSFDLWVNMGAVELETPADMALLKYGSVPKLVIREADITNGDLTIDAALAPLEIRLVEITLK